MVFPVVGQVTYSDDFGDPRGTGRHEGNDIAAAKRSLAVAAEAGTVKFWTTSRNAGCMLYLYGESGTTYFYIHLNNDLTLGNDNRGRCVAGVAYAKGLKSGDHVEAGEPIGLVGDSGDANGIASHLHFEVHPRDGAAVSPYPYLKRATQLLFAAKPGSTFTLAVTGQVAASETGRLTLNAKTVRSWPGSRLIRHEGLEAVLDVPDTAEIDSGPLVAATQPVVGQTVTVWTTPAKVTLAAQSGAAGTLAAAKIVFK
jgi:Peptidase family M23